MKRGKPSRIGWQTEKMFLCHFSKFFLRKEFLLPMFDSIKGSNFFVGCVLTRNYAQLSDATVKFKIKLTTSFDFRK
jgi:hypothetical protein